jgi:hypothetical protein
MPTSRNEVFISYARSDEKWKNLLLQHLAPLMRDGSIKVWHDGMIQSGAKWEEEIGSALARARVAVLLATPAFLASPFIARKEMPPILKAASNDGLIICWISVKSCLYEETPLGHYQAMNNPARPLATFVRSQHKIDEELVRIAKQIREHLKAESAESFTLGVPRVPFHGGQNADFAKVVIPTGAVGFSMKLTQMEDPYWRCGFVLAPVDYIHDGRSDIEITEYFLFHLFQGRPTGISSPPIETLPGFNAFHRRSQLVQAPAWLAPSPGPKPRLEFDVQFSDGRKHVTINSNGRLLLRAEIDSTYFANLYLVAWADYYPPVRVTIDMRFA